MRYIVISRSMHTATLLHFFGSSRNGLKIPAHLLQPQLPLPEKHAYQMHQPHSSTIAITAADRAYTFCSREMSMSILNIRFVDNCTHTGRQLSPPLLTSVHTCCSSSTWSMTPATLLSVHNTMNIVYTVAVEIISVEVLFDEALQPGLHH